MTEVHLFDLASQTFIHTPRHHKTARIVAQHSAGLEFRVVMDNTLDAYKVPHVDIHGVLTEAPDHLVDWDRRNAIKEFCDEVDRRLDFEIELAKLTEAGICLEDFPFVKEGGLHACSDCDADLARPSYLD